MKFFDTQFVPIEQYKSIEMELLESITEALYDSSVPQEEIQSFVESFKENHNSSDRSIIEKVKNLDKIYHIRNDVLHLVYDLLDLTSTSKRDLVRFGEQHEMNVAHLYNNPNASKDIHAAVINCIDSFISNATPKSESKVPYEAKEVTRSR
jgi:hypothetical protein